MSSSCAGRVRGSERRAQRGLGLIEVLVAVVVVSLGVLGMASLQLTGMKHSTGSYHRANALMLAEDMASRMRINKPAVEGGAFRSVDSAALNCAAKPAPYCQAQAGGTVAEACSVGELARFDIFTVACGDWGTAGAGDGVAGLLPDGQLQVSCVDAPCQANSIHQVAVSWQEGSDTSLDVNEVQTRTVQLRLRP